MSANESKSSFFRNSGWMVVATCLGGVLMTLVQSVAKHMEDSEFAAFAALLRLLMVLNIPTVALQAVFAQQTAAAITDERSRSLVSTSRAILCGSFIYWLVTGVLLLACMGPLSEFFKVKNPAAFRIAILVLLPMLWAPIFKGILQGEHRFAGLGWLQILDGVGRFGAILVVVLVFKGTASGAILAALAGVLLSAAPGAWLTRHTWARKSVVRFAWKAWASRAVPLTMGLGAVILMYSLDTLFVQSFFYDSAVTALYLPAMFTGFAIIQFIAPVSAVMFPLVVRSLAHGKKSNALLLTITVTTGVGVLAATGCTLLPKLPLQVLFFTTPESWKAAFLVPWFAWGLLPLTIANVLIYNQLAQERYKSTLWLISIPAVYWLTLMLISPWLLRLEAPTALKTVVQVQGIFNLLLCGVAAWFAWREPVSVPDPALREHSVCDKASVPSGRRTS